MTTWQAIVFAVGSILFTPALVSMALASYRAKRRIVPLASSIPTGLILWAYVLTWITFGPDYIYPAVTTACTAAMWTLLAVSPWKNVQRHPMEKR